MIKVITVLGPPCSGKDTHAKILARKLNYKYFSTGELINSEIAKETKFGVMAKKYLEMKKPIPDELLVSLIKEEIMNLKEDGIVFNKFPMTINQAKMLDTFLFARKTSKVIPIILETSKVIILHRVSKTTKKDVAEAFADRMNEFENKLSPIIEYYKSDSLKFDTTVEFIDDVNENILTTLANKKLLN
jgi:adenylate kinase